VTCSWSVRPAQVQLSAGQQLCVVCHDVANGIHFGAITCEGCKVSLCPPLPSLADDAAGWG